ncbi:Uncharacterized membrane protein YhaH, DUF805 family [Novosphingobium sp. CF614]|uniref:DUF805 domain-containing protein n=1 Tax=Novosphingobium sp. CF614 TaxID=1884364 RepID=UPI0008E2AF02|nr:DUF805 domain-containing protein [Novosphingobium sp. CF614]SFF93989.1 Uncharacterized membrane protein YhaH, DUF805 family [Novosphingobium sp. CF614]
MLGAIKYNLSSLANFAGRDSRSTFWYYVLFLVILQFAVSFAISIPMTGSMMGDALTAARNGADEVEIQRRVMEKIGGLMRATMWASAFVSLAMTGLVAASFTRRLHDSNKPGWIAGIAVAIQLLAIAVTIGTIDDAVKMVAMAQVGELEAVQALQGKMILRGLIGWIPLILVILFGAWPSTDGDNRYGPEPDHM